MLTVSIPPWFDFAPQTSEQSSSSSRVSIPPWFDFAVRATFTTLPDVRSFNPTLVRFCLCLQRALDRDRAVSIPPWFDFAEDRDAGRGRRYAVSIPPWFDFAIYRLHRHVRRRLFQSHLGSILPVRACWHDALLERVSIPPWFDFAGGPRRRTRTQVRGFNPTLVRFCRQAERIPAPGQHLFQSHLGSILPYDALGAHGAIALFQSHLGSILPP